MAAEAIRVPTVEEVADQFGEFTAFHRRFDRELRSIAEARVPLSQATARRLAVLVGVVERAAEIRVALARMEQHDLMAGVALWMNRQSGSHLPSAVERAALVWTAGRLVSGGDT